MTTVLMWWLWCQASNSREVTMRFLRDMWMQHTEEYWIVVALAWFFFAMGLWFHSDYVLGMCGGMSAASLWMLGWRR